MRTGDHVTACTAAGVRHAIYIGDQRVIHYCAESRRGAPVTESSLERFCDGAKVGWVSYRYCLPPEISAEIARRFARPQAPGVHLSGEEQFAVLCKTMNASDAQIYNVVEHLGAISLAVLSGRPDKAVPAILDLVQSVQLGTACSAMPTELREQLLGERSVNTGRLKQLFPDLHAQLGERWSLHSDGHLGAGSAGLSHAVALLAEMERDPSRDSAPMRQALQDYISRHQPTRPD